MAWVPPASFTKLVAGDSVAASLLAATDFCCDRLPCRVVFLAFSVDILER
jgi:hypothetical protein